MCGIFAIIGQSASTNNEEKRLYDAIDSGRKNQKCLRHRGPDWEGEYQWGRVYITHHRLAIIDPESGGQPLVCPLSDKYPKLAKHVSDPSRAKEIQRIILSVNGEIYNYKELKHKIYTLWKSAGYGEYTYMTNSDCEVIIPLYLYYTRYCIDQSRSDTTGRYASGLSSMLSMLEGMFSFILHDEALDTTLVVRDPMGITSLYYGFDHNGIYHVSSEMKAFNNDVCPCVFPAGNFMYFGDKYTAVPTLTKYYDGLSLTDDSITIQECEVSDADSAGFCSGIRQRLTDAVDKRMQTDVPFGILLSGGLDSSLITSIATRIADGRIPSKYGIVPGDFGRLSTFSIGLEGSPDLAAAENVAKFLGTRHHSLTFTVEEGVAAIRDLIYHLETYDVTTIRASCPMYLLSRKIKAMGIKMVLSGEGSDELFGGYLYFLQSPDNNDHQKERASRLANLQYADNLRANKSTMSWGIEARVPFEDTELVSYGLHNVPSSVMKKNNVEKWILRKAFHNPEDPWLPDDIVWRQKEQFSDGVGYSWIDKLVSLAKVQVTDLMLSLAPMRYPFNTPVNKEEYYYRTIFEELFPGKNWDSTVVKWIPRTDWEGVGYDPSGRAQKTHANTTVGSCVDSGGNTGGFNLG